MANKSSDKNKAPVLRRGMSEVDWAKTDAPVTPSKKHPYDWGIPRELRPGASTKPAETPAQRSARLTRWFRIAIATVGALAVLLFLVQSSLRGFEADGVSMEPTVLNGDTIIVNKLAYSQADLGLLDWAGPLDPDWRWNRPDRGDIVVFQSPVDDKELVKRVIGLPGEFIVIDDDRVYVDGKRLAEPYAVGDTECEGPCNWRVPAGHYFVLGDNRENSLDSRDGWTVPLDAIDGEKLISY
jgi:signal peptidase I